MQVVSVIIDSHAFELLLGQSTLFAPVSIDELRLQIVVTQLSQIVLLPIELKQLVKVSARGHVRVLEEEHNYKVDEVFVGSPEVNGHFQLWGQGVPLGQQRLIYVCVPFVET